MCAPDRRLVSGPTTGSTRSFVNSASTSPDTDARSIYDSSREVTTSSNAYGTRPRTSPTHTPKPTRN
jgi:hypothetical protein